MNPTSLHGLRRNPIEPSSPLRPNAPTRPSGRHLGRKSLAASEKQRSSGKRVAESLHLGVVALHTEEVRDRIYEEHLGLEDCLSSVSSFCVFSHSVEGVLRVVVVRKRENREEQNEQKFAQLAPT